MTGTEVGLMTSIGALFLSMLGLGYKVASAKIDHDVNAETKINKIFLRMDEKCVNMKKEIKDEHVTGERCFLQYNQAITMMKELKQDNKEQHEAIGGTLKESLAKIESQMLQITKGFNND